MNELNSKNRCNVLKTRITTGKVCQNTQSIYNQHLARGWLALSITTAILIQSSYAGFACLSNPCVFGVCLDDLNSTYSCFCIDGYTGIQCQTNWDECWELPCENGGTCIDGVAQYNCSCPEGFTGLNCEENVDECLSNPCQNGGMCHDHENGYTCTCLPGFFGIFCEMDIAVCETGNKERCHNGAECLEGSGLEFSCKCSPGWQGRYCDDKIDECTGSPCQNGAVCVDKIANYACACLTGFTGINCEETVLLCADSPCYNNALCLMEDGRKVCYCVPDYHGEKCELQYDECNLGPRCINGGTCIDGVDNFTCSCPQRLSGILCECLELSISEKDCNFIQETSLTSEEWVETTTFLELKTTFITTKSDKVDEFLNSTLTSVPTKESSSIIISSSTITNKFSTTTDRLSYTDSVTNDTSEMSSKNDMSTESYTFIITFTEEMEETSKRISSEMENTTIVDKNISSSSYYTTETPISATEPIISEFSTLSPFFTNHPTESRHNIEEGSGASTLEEATVTMSIAPTSTNWDSASADNITKSFNCTKTPCYNSGTCMNTSEGSHCICRFGSQGHLCESPVIIRNAAFVSDSYISHKIISQVLTPNTMETKNALSVQIELKARTRAMDGLIILLAAQGNKGGHYMSLFLHSGLLQFQFSCGLQTMLLSELETPVNTGDEIIIQAELDFSNDYSHCNASLRVNKTLAMSGNQPTWLSLKTKEKSIENIWLHLGNVSPQAPLALINDLPIGGQGFTGCLHSMKINNEPINIFSDAIDGFGITECGSLSCLNNPCRNGASCMDEDKNKNQTSLNVDKNYKWKCKCPTGYMGVMCEISVCDNNPCQYGGTCVTFPGSGYLCLCPLGKKGIFCENNLEIAQPSFSGSVKGLSSYVAYHIPFPIEYTLEISFSIRPTTISQISLIAFLGQSGSHDESSDHLAISFIQGYIMLTWNLGGIPRRIFTQEPLDIKEGRKQSFEIKIGRNGRQAWLSVDGKKNITGRSQGTKSRLDVYPVLFIGGHELSNFSTLPHDLPLHSGFQGCISDVRFISGTVSIPLQDSRDIRGRGVGQCETKECHKHACHHEGACLQYGATFTCICQDGWYGPLCAQSINVCDSTYNKCSSGSSCTPFVTHYECDCPLGKTGRDCNINIDSLSDVSLTGRRSYLIVKWPENIGVSNYEIAYQKMANYNLLTRIDRNNNTDYAIINRVQFFSIELQIRPLSEKGIILFFGALQDTVDTFLGFASISLQGGVVEFRLGGEKNHITILRSSRTIAIGEWHKIKISQNGKRLYLMVEESSTTTMLPSGFKNINEKTLVYIGGLPNLSKLPFNAVSGYPVPYRGCVRKLIINKTRIVLNKTNILDSRNINDCDGTSCGGDTCDLDGNCWLDEKLQPHCNCPKNVKGNRCELHESCNVISCKNKGVCLSTGCSCLNGWGGFYCEIATNNLSTPSFNGISSYIVIPPLRLQLKDKRGATGFMAIIYNKPIIQLSLNFSTITPDGLIVWSSDGRFKYFGLGIESGYLKLAYNLLKKKSVLIPTSFVIDGGYHSVQINTDQDSINLKLNGKVIFSEYIQINDSAELEQSSVTLENKFYIGGVPNTIIQKFADYNLFKLNNYRGCIRDFSFGNDADLQIKDFSIYEGQNIGVCDFYDEFL